MLSSRRLASGLFVLALGVGVAVTSNAANQLYQGSLIIESFGNDNVGGTDEDEFFEVLGEPQGLLCNPDQPRCSFSRTPVRTTNMGAKEFAPLGTICTPTNSTVCTPNCTPIAYFGTPTRPAKGATVGEVRYRNPVFFDTLGQPLVTLCTGDTTISGAQATYFLSTHHPKRGLGMKGAPLTGYQTVNLAGTGPAGFTLSTAPTTQANSANPFGFGIRRTTLGSFNNFPPYVYSYSYAQFRNDYGYFSAGGGPGNFTHLYMKGGPQTLAKAKVTAGKNQFGGVMRLLGQLTSKVCYFRQQGCSLGKNNWRYDAIGESTVALYTAVYYHTGLMQSSVIMVLGDRFPWTTGEVSLTAVQRGPHRTVERRTGYDNRTALGKGTIQLVTPLLTRWLQPSVNFETGGIAIMRLKFIPEPRKAMLLAAGLSVLAVLYRLRVR